ncbi:Pex19-domain-containing protein [Dothidotthia symphoricarpi CBS 119687]|uniref:Pex19-domain-containing protein n=1 Tax=Dothidotthia symphoricarpi CBS 119687 TaxID=1392245 RepID=A0A6A6A8P7_9PLEO|nr:Pex19-domain-containing protein [Dothidotthia symphoricarpi CBS 119687]KAF2127188.1 Pex19-domain-containing protein [Dothidotthia symphoricarpi CBS 119687]
MRPRKRSRSRKLRPRSHHHQFQSQPPLHPTSHLIPTRTTYVLDEFAHSKVESKAPAPSTATAPKPAAPPSSGPGRPEDLSPGSLLLEDEDEFAKQLQKEMESLLGQGDFQKQMEDIMKEMGEEMGGANPLAATSPPPKDSGAAKEADKNFQETIKKTMERMQSSGEAASSAAAASTDQDDMLAQMLKEMESGGFGGEGGDEDFSKILMGMMEQLTNKEILYEPMKELNDKFPKWMETNKEKVGKDDLKRYEEQQLLVGEITTRFERKGYSDGDPKDREYIVERMQKMQAAGSPPPDLVGDMHAAQEVLQDMDQGCPTQ